MAHDQLPSPRTRRSALSPAARSRRLQRIFARLCSAWAEIAERLWQIIRAATAPGRGHDGPDHKRMQIARLTPAPRLADAQYIKLLLNIIDQLDRYPDPPSANRPRRVAIAPCQLSKCLKTLKTARASYWLKLASIWDRRHVRMGFGAAFAGGGICAPLASHRGAAVAARTSGGRPLCAEGSICRADGAPSRRAKPTA